MNRRSLREQVFKLLFRVEFNEREEMEEQCHLFLEHEEVAMTEEEEAHIVGKYKAIHEKLEEIDVIKEFACIPTPTFRACVSSARLNFK